MTESVVAGVLGVARLGLAALLLRRLALVAVAAAVVVVLVARRREVIEKAVAHRRFLSGEGNDPSSGDEDEVTMWSQHKDDLCASCQPAQRKAHVCEPAQGKVKVARSKPREYQEFLFSDSAQRGE
jgi:hypothetical protein